MTLDEGAPVTVIIKTGERIEAEAWGTEAAGLHVTTARDRKRMFIPWLNIAAVEERGSR